MQAEKSGLAGTLVGGVLGAALGVALQVVLETGMLGQRIEASWCAIVIGILAGLGVRRANRHHMERSYLRGAVCGLIALAAMVASSFAIKEVMSRREVKAPTRQQAAANVEEEKADADEADAGGAAAEPAAEAPRPQPGGALGTSPRVLNSDINPWQFIFMAVGGFLAYDLGRGPDPSKRRAAEETDAEEPLVGGTDPSN